MAKAITKINKYIPTEEQLKQESADEILKALSENKEAILAFLDIVKEAHHAGLFDIAGGILKNRTDVARVGFEFIQVAGVPSMMKNGILAMQFLSKLDPLKVHMMLEGLNKGLERVSVNEENRTSMWGMIKSLKEPEVNASITVLLNFLRGMGTEFQESKQEIKEEIHETNSPKTT